jgi:hypothetical protein
MEDVYLIPSNTVNCTEYKDTWVQKYEKYTAQMLPCVHTAGRKVPRSWHEEAGLMDQPGRGGKRRCRFRAWMKS